MKFMVTRTSVWDNDKPCDGAIKEKYIRIDTRNASKPEDVPAYKNSPEWWYSEGTNHRIINGYIARDFEDEAWFIEIFTLEELIKFKDSVGSPIILNDFIFTNGVLELEIYDDYRE